MSRTLALVKVALGGLWCELSGQEAPLTSGEARLRFDREYEALLAEMVNALEPVSVARRAAARGR